MKSKGCECLQCANSRQKLDVIKTRKQIGVCIKRFFAFCACSCLLLKYIGFVLNLINSNLTHIHFEFKTYPQARFGETHKLQGLNISQTHSLLLIMGLCSCSPSYSQKDPGLQMKILHPEQSGL